MPIEAVLVVAIIAIAFFGESIFGFGGGLVAIPLLSLMLGVRDAVTLVLIFQLCMGLLIWKSYRQIDWKTAKPMTLALIVGTIIGTLLLSNASVTLLQLLLAFSIIVFLIKAIWFDGFTATHKRKVTSARIAGLGGGLFQGLIGTGGPVLTMYLAVASPRKLSLRATLIYLFFITSVVRLGISIPQHLFTDRIIQLALITLPFFLAAILLGQKMHKKISGELYQQAIYLILAGAAIVLLSKALF